MKIVTFFIFLFCYSCHSQNHERVLQVATDKHEVSFYSFSWHKEWIVEKPSILDNEYFDEYYTLILLPDSICILDLKRIYDIVPSYALAVGRWMKNDENSFRITALDSTFVIKMLKFEDRKVALINGEDYTIKEHPIDTEKVLSRLDGLEPMIEGAWYTDNMSGCPYESMSITFTRKDNFISFESEEFVQESRLLYFFEGLDIAYFENEKVFKMEFLAEDMESDVGRIVIKHTNEFEDLVICDFYRE